MEKIWTKDFTIKNRGENLSNIDKMEGYKNKHYSKAY